MAKERSTKAMKTKEDETSDCSGSRQKNASNSRVINEDKQIEDASDDSSTKKNGARLHNDNDSDEEENPPARKHAKIQMTESPATRTGHPKSRKGLSKGQNVGQPREPTGRLLEFRTDTYETYDFDRDGNLNLAFSRFKGNYQIYENHKLLTGGIPSGFKPGKVPNHVVRLDDEWIGFVTGRYRTIDLGNFWSAEFDQSGMVRATRVPLGRPCLIWAERGVKDVNGVEVQTAGVFYAWYRGLQLLCGDVGLAAGLFKIRPSYEKPLCKTLHFKIGYPAARKSKGDCGFEAINKRRGGSEVVALMDGDEDDDEEEDDDEDE